MCFACDIWPSSASSWIDRCRFWPEKEVVSTIVSDGCHFVPIGNPQGLEAYKNKEWRISFSLAEQKLVYTMNHCQFLVYGLLKIFLKEVINNLSDETKDLLCSYHMKTVVFWVIQENTVPFWCPQNLLAGFWVCFKLLLKWVYEGVCPNFFIPRNNMFLSKVHGSAQTNLFLKMHHLYEQGLAYLLQSPSIWHYVTDILHNPRLCICTLENRTESDVEYFKVDFNEILIRRSANEFITNVQDRKRHFHTIEKLIDSLLTPCQIGMLHKTATSLQNAVFKFRTKQMYIVDKMFCHMLKLAINLRAIFKMVYTAMLFYKRLRYKEAICVLVNIKCMLPHPIPMDRRKVEMLIEALEASHRLLT